ncbi:MAG: hypothetical protein WBG86_21230, partial [Polyangiales bacterium]
MSDSQRELNRDTVFHLAARRWDLLLLLPLLTTLAAAFVWQVVPSQYEATARLLIQDQHTLNPFDDDEMVQQWSAQRRMPLIESIFESHDTSERVLRKLGRLGVSATTEEVNEEVAIFQDSFDVMGLGGELIMIKARGKTPEDALDSASALIEAFTDQIVRPQRERVRASAVLFQEQLQQLRGTDGDIGSSPAESPALGEVNLRQALAQAEARLAAVEQAVEVSEDDLREGSPREKRLQKSLAEARRRVYLLRNRFGRNHPAYADAKRRVRDLETAIDREHSNRKAVPGTTSSPTTRAPGPDGKGGGAAEDSDHRALLVELKEAAAEVELLQNGLLTEDLSFFADSNQVWPVENPVLPSQPLGPSFFLVLLGALAAGLILALLAVAFFAAFDDSLRGERELAEAIGAPSLGKMPRG